MALKTERTAKVKILHKFIFENEGNIQNRQTIHDFSGLLFQIESEENYPSNYE